MEMVTTAGLTRRFGKLTAVKPLTVDLPAGKVIGLVGPNGSGKSTLIRMLLGLMRPSAGEATVLGEPISSPGRYLGRVGALVERPRIRPGLVSAGQSDIAGPVARLTECARRRGASDRGFDQP
jgi:ABC-2 type transport system ATP-binding protein